MKLDCQLDFKAQFSPLIFHDFSKDQSGISISSDI